MKQELESTLVAKIIETYDESVRLAGMAKEHALQAIQKVIECGQYLIEAKTSVGHGRWYAWYDNHIANRNHGSDFTIRTATKYMRLAETPADQLKDAYSIRQAYIAAGILEQGGGHSNHINRDPDGTNWISILSGFTIKVEQLFDRRPIHEWQESDRQLFIERARPVVKRYVEAGGTL
jgi:hypothetical protein